MENFAYILKQGKHNTSANRLQKLLKTLYPEFSEQLKKLIKKYGYAL
jgi:hypothetical protein